MTILFYICILGLALVLVILIIDIILKTIKPSICHNCIFKITIIDDYYNGNTTKKE
jgi:hypothetical protein